MRNIKINMMKTTNKKRLFEVMGRLDKTFKPRLNESIQGNKTFTLNLLGEETPLRFEFDHYMNGALFVGLVNEEEPYADVSTNLPESGSLPKDEFFLKSWSENEELANELIKKGIIVPTGKQASMGARSYKINPAEQ
jgi:hypothetical protein